LSGINKNLISKSSILSYGVFGFSVSIVLLCCVSVIFPALIQSTNSEFKEFPFYTPQVDPFEIGALAIPFVIVNGILLLIGIVYYKKKYSLNRLFNFDVSKKVTIIIMIIILSAYIITTVPEFEKSEEYEDRIRIDERLNESRLNGKFTIQNLIDGNSNYPSIEPHVKYSLLIISEKVFGEYRVVAFFASIALLVTTFFITKEITKKRIPGIIAMLLVLQSNIFLSYDTSAAYSNFWILFYVLSLYFILKKWQLSHISFALSIFSKFLSGIFLPLTIFFVLNNTNGKKRIYILTFYIILIIAGLFAISDLFGEINITYLPENFLKGFTQFSYQLIFDPMILIFLLPLTVALFLKSLKGFNQANSIQILISGFLLVPPLLITFSEQTNEPYRLIPLVVFFAIGMSTLLGKIKQDEPLSK
jgi:hypothetical protein